jgi:hypothetical protein
MLNREWLGLLLLSKQQIMQSKGMLLTSDNRCADRIRARIRDFVLYLAIGIAFIVAIVFVSHRRFDHDAFIRWGGLAVNTVALYGYFVANSRLSLRKWSFWAMITIFLCIHLAAFGMLLVHVDEWKLTWFVVMALEYPLLAFSRNRLYV